MCGVLKLRSKYRPLLWAPVMPPLPSIRVLLIEDSPTDRDLLAISLEDVTSARFEIQSAETLAEGLQQLAEQSFDVVLLDLNLPDSYGVETCDRLHRTAPSVPIIVLTGLSDEERALAAFKVGAQDYLVKGQCDGALLYRAITYAIERHASNERVRQADERLRLISAQLPAVLWTTDAGMRFTAPTTHCLANTDASCASVGADIGEWCATHDIPPNLIVAHGQGLRGQSASLNLNWRQKSYSVHVEPLKNAAGVIIGTIGLSLDISQQQRMRDELNAARQVQQALFPHAAPHVPNFDIAGNVFPAEETAGDCYDFIPMRGGWTGLVVGDVAGHGLGPALLMAELRAYLRMLATLHENVADILMAANRLIASDLEDYRFVTLFFGRLHAESRRFEFASAGHTGFVIRNSGQTETLSSTGVPLGLFGESVIELGRVIELHPGDLLLLPTDGIQEAQNANRKMFGIDRMLSFVHAHRHEPAAAIIEGLRTEIADFTGSSRLADDTTAIIARTL